MPDFGTEHAEIMIPGNQALQCARETNKKNLDKKKIMKINQKYLHALEKAHANFWRFSIMFSKHKPKKPRETKLGSLFLSQSSSSTFCGCESDDLFWQHTPGCMGETKRLHSLDSSSSDKWFTLSVPPHSVFYYKARFGKELTGHLPEKPKMVGKMVRYPIVG